jgi:CRP-like cAMP-binding protein
VAQQLRREPLPLAPPIPAGVVVVRQGDLGVMPRIVVSGALIERHVTAEGRELVPELPGVGDLVGADPSLPSPVTVTTVRRTVLRPAAPHEVVAGLARRHERALTFAAELAWQETTAHIERRLRELAAQHGRPAHGGGTAVGITLTQEDLAGLVGTTRETANRAIRSLLAHGSIGRTARGRYVIGTSVHLVGS